MGKIVLFDYGHGGRDSGATYMGRLEKTDVFRLGRDVKKKVEEKGVTVDETRKDDSYISLGERCRISCTKDYDFLVSFHRNAFRPNQADGVEVFTFTARKPKAVELASNVVTALTRLGFTNRGVKSAKFKVLADSCPDAVLLEVGFLDSDKDNRLFDTKYNEIVDAIANSILDALGVEYNSTDLFYRVVSGSYKNRENAEKQIEKLNKLGINSFISLYRGG